MSGFETVYQMILYGDLDGIINHLKQDPTCINQRDAHGNTILVAFTNIDETSVKILKQLLLAGFTQMCGINDNGEYAISNITYNQHTCEFIRLLFGGFHTRVAVRNLYRNHILKMDPQFVNSIPLAKMQYYDVYTRRQRANYLDVNNPNLPAKERQFMYTYADYNMEHMLRIINNANIILTRFKSEPKYYVTNIKSIDKFLINIIETPQYDKLTAIKIFNVVKSVREIAVNTYGRYMDLVCSLLQLN